MWSGGQDATKPAGAGAPPVAPPQVQPGATLPPGTQLPPGARRPRGGRAAQNKEIEEQKKENKQYKLDQIKDSIHYYEQQIEDLKARLNDEIPRSDQAQTRQIDLKAEEIKSTLEQTRYLQEKHNELLAKAASNDSTAQMMRWRLFIDSAMWKSLSIRDHLEKIQSAWEDACFSFMKATNDMGRAITGTGGQARAHSGRTVRPYAGEKPSDQQALLSEQTAMDTHRTVSESDIGLRAQQAKIADATKQIESERNKLKKNVGEEKKTAEEKIARYQTRLEEVKKKLVDAGGTLEKSAATFLGA